jgi:hypothetical protein
MPATSAADIPEPLTSVLRVVVDLQAMKNWCWAAVGAGIHNFYRPATPLTQFQVASQVLDNPTCAISPTPNSCNKLKEIPDVLTALGVPYTRRTGPLTWSGLKIAIDSKIPVVARIAWDNGIGHFVVLSAYENAHSRVVVLDPKIGARLVPFSGFPANTRPGTRWTHSYLAPSLPA